MFANVTSLRYWKSERADITTCEDALASNIQRGLFCVADGAGTTLFSNIWADILVKQFVRDPLIADDPFEMEWWIRQAQKQYRDLAPRSDKLNWNARQKAIEQGAYATLATLHFTHLEQQSAKAELLVIGDSCIIIGNPKKQQIIPFPLQHTEDFDRAPYCVPSLLKNLNRYALYARMQEITLSVGDIVILATDAVARWIISGGGTGNEQAGWNAFLEVAQKTEGDWPGFINACRANQLIVDDDSTAVIIRLEEEGREEDRLGIPGAPRPELLTSRITEFEQARAENNKELLAIAYGDGHMLNGAGISLTDTEKAKAQEVANALRDVLQAMRETVNTANFATKMEPTWWKYADVLMNEPCAENIRNSLTTQGVHLQRPAPAIPQQPARPVVLPPQGGNTAFQPLAGVAPEFARTLTLSQVAPPIQREPQQKADVLEFRKALTTHDPLAIVATYQPSFDTALTAEERIRLQEAQNALRERLFKALDSNDEASIIAAAKVIEEASVQITIPELVKQRIQHIREQQAAFDRLLNALEEGTVSQKVEASKLLQKHNALNTPEKEQLEMAQHMVDAFSSNNDEMISSAYKIIEFSPLRKHFIFSPEEQRRIEQAQQEREAVTHFRFLLESGSATLALLVKSYQKIHSPTMYLSQDELYITDKILHFLELYQIGRQAKEEKDTNRSKHLVRLYDALYYSPYRFTFTENETRHTERARGYAASFIPPIMTVNNVQVNISQFLALYRAKPLYAQFQITMIQKALATEPPGSKRQERENELAYWMQQMELLHLPETVLDDLIHRILLEQKISEEILRDKAKRSLEKEVQKWLDEIIRELRTFTGKDVQDIRDALTPYALYEVFSRYLLGMPSRQMLPDLLHERRKTATIYYFERPEMLTTTMTERQRCWLFKWWLIRDNYNAALQQETI